jgi:Ca2+-binding RTX toxin-like protein
MATFTVTNTNDSGAGSLRQAILDANAAPGADEIEFAATASGTIQLTSGRLQITSDLTINGLGAAALTVDGNGADVFEIAGAGNTVALTAITVENGEDGIEIDASTDDNTLTVTDSIIARNLGDDGLSIDGFRNTVVVENSFFERNEDNLAVEGSDNIVTVTNTTTRLAREDGVEIDGNGNRVTVENSTISNNGVEIVDGNVVVVEPNDGLDVDGSRNLLTIEQTIFNLNTEDGLDLEGADNHAIVKNSTFTGNVRDGILVQDATSTSTVVVENAGGGDRLLGGGGDDEIRGRSGVDRLGGGGGDDELDGGGNGDVLNGDAGDDVLRGGSGNDSGAGFVRPGLAVAGRGLFGDEGNDELDGGTGSDFLDGGGGDDVVRGGSGIDTFRFDDDSGGFDTFEDFRLREDVLQLDISRATFQTAFGNTVTAADRGVDALDPDDGRGTRGGELVIDFADAGTGDSVLTLEGVNQLSIDQIVFV